MEIRWTRKALENLDAIAAYIALDNSTRACSFVGEIKEKTALLAPFPAIGRPGRVPVFLVAAVLIVTAWIATFWAAAFSVKD